MAQKESKQQQLSGILYGREIMQACRTFLVGRVEKHFRIKKTAPVQK